MSTALERPRTSRAKRTAAEKAGPPRSTARDTAVKQGRDVDERAPRHAEPDADADAAPAPHRPTGGSMRGRLVAAGLALCLLPALLAGAAAYATTHYPLPTTHYVAEVWTGRSELIFHLPELSGDAANRFLATQPVVVTSYPLIEPLAVAEGLPVEALDRGLSASLVQGSTLMRIEYRDTDPARILRGLESLTEGYLTLLRDMALIEGASHRLLIAPFLLEAPVGRKPEQVAAIGAVIGLAIAFAGLVVMAQLRRPD